ncbi:MAG TPA: translation initiation factor IF-3, partial [Caldisericia bacterium]|nr:translation initiation factor IF-3 [Caldisericia bacterium]
NGHRTKVVIRFRGREMMHKDQGRALLDRIANEVASLGTVEQMPKMDGRHMHMMIAPTKQKEKEIK